MHFCSFTFLSIHFIKFRSLEHYIYRLGTVLLIGQFNTPPPPPLRNLARVLLLLFNPSMKEVKFCHYHTHSNHPTGFSIIYNQNESLCCGTISPLPKCSIINCTRLMNERLTCLIFVQLMFHGANRSWCNRGSVNKKLMTHISKTWFLSTHLMNRDWLTIPSVFCRRSQPTCPIIFKALIAEHLMCTF